MVSKSPSRTQEHKINSRVGSLLIEKEARSANGADLLTSALNETRKKINKAVDFENLLSKLVQHRGRRGKVQFRGPTK